MPIFYYKAKSKIAQTVTGQLQAPTQEQAVELITQQGLLPVVVQENPLSVTDQPAKIIAARMKSKELYLFSRQLAALIKAGVSILPALRILSEQTTSASVRALLAAIHSGIKDGRSFSDCLQEYPRIFNPLYVSMVRVGEEGGNLKEILLRLAEHLQKEEEISGKVRTALAYPLFMAVVGLGTVFFILTFVMPRITQMFSNLHQALPWPTEVLMVFSSCCEKFWVPALFVSLTLILLARFLGRTPRGKMLIGQVKLQTPFVRDLVLRSQLASFCRTLELLQKSGVSLLRGLSIAPPTLTNEVIKEQLAGCRRDVEAGQRLSESLQTKKFIPPMMLSLVRVGEESGSLENSLKEIADVYEQETNEAVKTITTLLEPVMILGVGLVVGAMVLAMLLPIFQMDIMAQ